MNLQLVRRIVSPAGSLVEQAQLVMGRGMVGHGSDHVLKVTDRVGDLPERPLRHPHLEVERRHSRLDLPGLLERLCGRLGLVLPQERAAQQEIRRGAVGIELE